MIDPNLLLVSLAALREQLEKGVQTLQDTSTLIDQLITPKPSAKIVTPIENMSWDELNAYYYDVHPNHCYLANIL